LIRDGVEGGSKQPAVLGAQTLLALFESGHQMPLGVIPSERDACPLGPLASLGDVAQDLLDFCGGPRSRTPAPHWAEATLRLIPDEDRV